MSAINTHVVKRQLHYNNFNLSHAHLTSGRLGKLIPVSCIPVIPGDLMDVGVEFNMRFSPLSAPAMAMFNVHFHSFYVPYRIITPRNGQESTWEKFVMSIGKPLTEVPTLPCFYCDPTLLDDFGQDYSVLTSEERDAFKLNFMAGSLWDYMKLPVIPFNYPDDAFISIRSEELGAPGILAFNFLAYLKIWNDWYRRDQIEKEVVFPLNLGRIDINGDVGATDFVEPEMPEALAYEVFSIQQFIVDLLKLRTRNYERDYFTSGLPDPQFGDDVKLGGGKLTALAGASLALLTRQPLAIVSPEITSSEANIYGYPFQSVYGGNLLTMQGDSTPTVSQWNLLDYSSGGPGNFSVQEIQGIEAIPFSINELRLAMQLQGIKEQINRTGTRYLEIMEGVFGVSVSDLRLQRPQYLGGVKAPVSIGAVIQTSATEDGSPQGNLSGIAGTAGGNKIFRTKRIFEEAGVVMTIMSVTPRTGYFGGIERQYLKHDPIDYYTPMLDHLGEQETMRSELFYTIYGSNSEGVANLGANEDKAFAYNPHYQEYRSIPSTVTGEFRDTLDNWHIFRSFSQAPVLSPEFIHAEPEDFDRLFTFENIENTSNEHFQCQLYFHIKAKRPMSKYGTPFTLF